MAAAALAALEYTIPLLPRVHALARRTADSLRTVGYKFLLPVQTNMIVLDLEDAGIPAAAFVEYGKRAGVTLFPTGRIVFHHQISPEAASRLVKAMTCLIEDARAGKELENHKVTGGYM